MAEPLFIVADIHISAPALRRWLKSAPLSAAAFDDWPASASLGASGITELAAPEKPSVADALVSYCADGFGRGDGHLHCQHDEQAHAPDSRRASSMATRPAPWRPRFSLRFAARIGGRLHGKAALARPPVRRRRRSDPYRDRQAVPRVLPAPAHAPAAPHGSTTGSARTTWATAGSWPRCSPWPRALKKQLALGALQASPAPPHHSHFWTDGEHVYRWPGDQPVPGAATRTFRRVTPANAMDSAFYTDGRQVWYHRPMVGRARTGA